MSGVAAAKADGSHTYIFSEAELEEHEFHAAAFVAKYRRVTPLESLRDQFRQCVQGLKDQVRLSLPVRYALNIVICHAAVRYYQQGLQGLHLHSHKGMLHRETLLLHQLLIIYVNHLCSLYQLEGVDTRVDHLRKPLVDLRMEALSLHDSLVTPF